MVDRAVEAGPVAPAATGRIDGTRAGEWVQEVLALARRWFILLRRERLNLAFSVVQPAIWLVFFGLGIGRAVDHQVIGTSDYLGFVLPGIVAFTVIGNGVSSAMPLLFDKETGYLDKLLSLPIARSSIIVSRFVQQLVLGSGQVLLVIIVAAAIGVDIATGPAGVLVILLAAGLLTLAVTSAFLALAYYVPGHGTFFAITGFATLPMVFLSNAFVPLEALPGWMAAIARLNPLTYAIEAIRLLVLEGWTAGIGGSIGALTIAAAVLLGIGTHQFRRQTGERVG